MARSRDGVDTTWRCPVGESRALLPVLHWQPIPPFRQSVPPAARLAPAPCRGTADRHGAGSKTPAKLVVTHVLRRRSQPSRLQGVWVVTRTDVSCGAEGFATRSAARRTTRDPGGPGLPAIAARIVRMGLSASFPVPAREE